MMTDVGQLLPTFPKLLFLLFSDCILIFWIDHSKSPKREIAQMLEFIGRNRSGSLAGTYGLVYIRPGQFRLFRK